MCEHQCACPLCVTERGIQTSRLELVGLVRGSSAWLAAREKLETFTKIQAMLHQYIDARQIAFHEAVECGGVPSAGGGPSDRAN
jgi:hypothetical protein